MKKNIKKSVLNIVFPLIPVMILVVLTIMTPFFSMEGRLTDTLYKQLEGVSRNIKIITVDEEALEEYGSFANWSREKSAELLKLLYADGKNAPKVVGLDFLFVDEAEKETDALLVEA